MKTCKKCIHKDVCLFRNPAEDEKVCVNYIDKTDEWIAVKDKLPNVGVRVLTLSKYNRISDRELYKYKHGELIFRPDGMKPISDITHWMPLPKPPRTPKERGGEK